MARLEIVLDLDAIDDPLHGAQEGHHFHASYDCHCYQPLYVTCGEHVMRDAHQNMVTAGRHATDVEDESRRICDHFQGEARECQAEFMRRFEPRMCD